MKTLNFEQTNDILIDFALTIEEMICVRGGDSDPVMNPSVPPIRI